MDALTGFLTTKEASQRLGVTASRVRQLVLQGSLEAVKAGRDLLVLEHSVAQFESIGRRERGRPRKILEK
jgi:excisionase family DNA binding protein